MTTRRVTITVPPRQDATGVWAGGRQWLEGTHEDVELDEPSLMNIVWRPQLVVMEGTARLTSEGPGKPIKTSGGKRVEAEAAKVETANAETPREQVPHKEEDKNPKHGRRT